MNGSMNGRINECVDEWVSHCLSRGAIKHQFYPNPQGGALTPVYNFTGIYNCKEHIAAAVGQMIIIEFMR